MTPQLSWAFLGFGQVRFLGFPVSYQCLMIGLRTSAISAIRHGYNFEFILSPYKVQQF
jgi:hypothetical protein